MTSCILVNGVEIYKYKAKGSVINAASLCLDNVSKHFFQLIIWKRLDYMDNFSVDFDSIYVYDILDIHKYLMKKHDQIM